MARRGGKNSATRGGGPKGSAARSARRSAAVYRRRRLAVGVLLACVLALVGAGAWGAVSLVRGAGKGAPARTAEDDGPVAASTGSASAPAPADAPQPSGTPSAADVAATPSAPPTPTCDPAKIAVTASTDKTVYAPTESPVLTLKVTNQNSIQCPVNVGTSQMEYLIVSGADRIFDSKDCQDGAADLVKTLDPGASETANLPWPRTRSTEGCKAVAVKPRPGMYVLTASLGPLQSKKAVFELQ